MRNRLGQRLLVIAQMQAMEEALRFAFCQRIIDRFDA